MILTQGEKMVWAATFALTRQKMMGGLSRAEWETTGDGGNTEAYNDVLLSATSEAWSAVQDLRQCEEVASEDTIPMLRAMLGDDG